MRTYPGPTLKSVYVVGTFDTKAVELRYVADLVREMGVPVVTVDVSSRRSAPLADFTNADVAAYHPSRPDFLGVVDDRGTAVGLMSEALGAFLESRSDLGGVIGIGGSGNTALVTAAMQRLPVGVPKVMVSTVASGNVAPYVGASDIAMLYSVTDVAGLNRISRVVLGNGAHAIAGMVKQPIPVEDAERPAVAITMFGVTTPCGNMLRERLDRAFDPIVFHATGTGGRSMEKLIDSGMISHVIDLTTTEVADLIVGGIMSAGDDRMEAIIRRGIPYVGAPGALDMVVFGAPETVPLRFAGRNLYFHNAAITLMRTTPEENRSIGLWIGEKLNRMTGPVRFLLPEKGVSLLDSEGRQFWDPEADESLYRAIEETVVQDARRRVERHPYSINDAQFADALWAAFMIVHNPAQAP